MHGTENIVEAMGRAGAPNLVHFTTDMIYGHTVHYPMTEDHPVAPLGEYGFSKLKTEELAAEWRMRGMKISLFRPRLIIGPGRLGILEKLFKLIDHNLPVPMIGSGRNPYQFISVFDCAEAARLVQEGEDAETAARRAGYRVFGSKPGSYGAGLQALIDEKGWAGKADLAEAYLVWGGYAYGAQAEGSAERGLFEERLKGMQAVVQNQDNREHDLLDSDDYYQFEGGMTAAVETLKGEAPTVYHNDHSRPERPVVRTLEEEIGRVVRARVVNPKWIAGVMRHGYKGAFEMAATVDYMFAFAATARCVKDHHFDAVFDAYLGDEDVRAFLEEHNPAALKEMSERLMEAQDRGLWRPRLNSTYKFLASLNGGVAPNALQQEPVL